MPTSHDVARLAGVSQPTVSRALSDDPRVAQATRRRVRQVATEIGYVPSRRGRSLSTRRTGQVAVVVSELSNPFYMQTIACIYEALEALGQRMVVLTEPSVPSISAERLLDGSVDGVILATTLLNSSLPAELALRGLPFVQFNRSVDEREFDACMTDNREGGRLAAEFLLGLGHRRIAMISGPANTSTGRDREAGFRAALGAAAVQLPDEHIARGPFTFASGYELTIELLAADRPPTALFCANDVIALGALSAARARGIDVPGRLTVIGFDDVEISSWEVVRLTTLRQDLPRMARESAALLGGRIADPGRPARRVVVPTVLIERATHGPPSASAGWLA